MYKQIYKKYHIDYYNYALLLSLIFPKDIAFEIVAIMHCLLSDKKPEATLYATFFGVVEQGYSAPFSPSYICYEKENLSKSNFSAKTLLSANEIKLFERGISAKNFAVGKEFIQTFKTSDNGYSHVNVSIFFSLKDAQLEVQQKYASNSAYSGGIVEYHGSWETEDKKFKPMFYQSATEPNKVYNIGGKCLTVSDLQYLCEYELTNSNASRKDLALKLRERTLCLQDLKVEDPQLEKFAFLGQSITDRWQHLHWLLSLFTLCKETNNFTTITADHLSKLYAVNDVPTVDDDVIKSMDHTKEDIFSIEKRRNLNSQQTDAQTLSRVGLYGTPQLTIPPLSLQKNFETLNVPMQSK